MLRKDNKMIDNNSVHKTELVRTSQSWDGVELPDYLVGKPEKDCHFRCNIQRYHWNNVTFGDPLATQSTLLVHLKKKNPLIII